jgi:cytochrome c oxidase assembly protein subunit 15
MAGDSPAIRMAGKMPTVPETAVPEWRGIFALVTTAATLLMLSVGGLVTSFQAGLAVPDWPNTFGSLLFLYPLSKMSGGIYFEHSHRLLGMLVGMSVFALALQIFFGGASKRLKLLAATALALVAFQGLLGGLRVTGRPTLSSARGDMAPSTALAMAHGVTAQMFFGLIVAINVLLSRAWRRGTPQKKLGARADWRLHAALACLLTLQIVAGVFVRQQRAFLHLHLTLGVLALILAFFGGIRTWGLYGQSALFARLGQALLALAALQGALGVAALFALDFVLERRASEFAQVAAVTCHQTVSALLFACAISLLLFSRRLLVGASSTTGE